MAVSLLYGFQKQGEAYPLPTLRLREHRWNSINQSVYGGSCIDGQRSCHPSKLKLHETCVPTKHLLSINGQYCLAIRGAACILGSAHRLTVTRLLVRLKVQSGSNIQVAAAGVWQQQSVRCRSSTVPAPHCSAPPWSWVLWWRSARCSGAVQTAANTREEAIGYN